jgi:NIMA (never in mitosis gene a)-related kinase
MSSIGDFEVLEKLGEGAYSSVFKVRRRQDRLEYALKKVGIANLSSKERENALNEVRLLASVKHPNIVAYKEAFLDETSNSLCIVMEYADDGDVFQLITRHKQRKEFIEESRIWAIFVQTLRGLQELHALRILHRDLKSANIFLTKDGGAKLGDMNVSKVAKQGLLYTQTGTPFYASPEVWKERPYNHKSDIWSLGCVLFEMCALKPPFRAEDMEGLYRKVITGKVPRIPANFSIELGEVIKSMLVVNPDRRVSCEQLLSNDSIKTYDVFTQESASVMIKTIKMPHNLYYLTDVLPRPNYNTSKEKKRRSPHPRDSERLPNSLLPALRRDPDLPRRRKEHPSLSRKKAEIEAVYGKKQPLQIEGLRVKEKSRERDNVRKSIKSILLPSLK